MPADIQAWVASSAGPGSPVDSTDDEAANVGVNGHDGVIPALSWDTALPSARQKLLTSKISVRQPYLEEVLLPLARREGQDLPANLTAELLKLLLLTAPRYNDRQSTGRVLDLVEALIVHREDRKASTALLEGTSKLVGAESERLCSSPHGTSTSAPTTRLALLQWSCRLFSVACKLHGAKEAPGTPAGGGAATALAALLDSLEDDQSTRRVTLRKTALVESRRVIRQNHEAIPSLIVHLTGSSSPRNAALIGTTIDVCHHLHVGSETTKGSPLGVGVGYANDAREAIVKWWLSTVLSSRTAQPTRHTTVLASLFRALDPSALDELVVPVAAKMLLRSPEASLPALGAFLSIWPHAPISAAARTALLTPTLSAAKTINPETREGAIEVFRRIAEKSGSDTAPLADEVAGPLKAGKSASAEHRSALLSMLASLPASKTSSPSLVDTITAVLAKETNEAALQAGGRALQGQLAFVLHEGVLVDKKTAEALAKITADPKPTVRRSACSAVGAAIWNASSQTSNPAVEALGDALAKSLATNLKNATTNPLANPAGPLEGYIAAALAFGPLASVASIAALRKSDPALSTVAVSGAKPNFLWTDRLYRKACGAEKDDGEGLWLARAVQATFPDVKAKIASDEAFRLPWCSTLLYLATECPHFGTRKAAIDVLDVLHAEDPKVVFDAIVAGVAASLQAPTPSDDPTNGVRGARLQTLLSSFFVHRADSTVSPPQNAQNLAAVFVLSHYATLDSSSSLWIRLAQLANSDPRAVLLDQFENVYSSIQAHARPSEAEATRDAAYRSAGTLAFIVPERGVARFVAEVKETIDPDKVDWIGAEGYGIWMTPAGTPFIDVLASKKDSRSVTKDPKQRAIDQWEAELREQLERKKSGGVKSLTKAEKALVDAQLAKEAETRSKVDETLKKLRHGFRILQTLIGARTEQLDGNIPTIVDRLLEVLALDAAALVAAEGLKTFTDLGSVCCDRLQPLRLPIALAVLRGTSAKVVPAELSAEPLHDLIIRILYRVRTAAEQQAVDDVTFAYFAPLLSRIISNRGLELESKDFEQAMEQVALAVDILQFGGASAARSPALRARLIDDCFKTITSYPQLTKAASTALTSISNAMVDDATPANLASILTGLLSAEAQARFAALQAAQPLDMTDLGWSPELWIARFDDEDRNADLAAELWVENGLEVPGDCLPSLLALLEHSAGPVRSAAAKGLGAAVQSHAGSAGSALHSIASRYGILSRELVPEYDHFGMVIQESLNREDPWRSRVAEADALGHLAPTFGDADIGPLFDLLIDQQSLGDRNEEVRSKMLTAGNTVIDIHGARHLENLSKRFEGVLARGSKGSDAADYVSEATVILFGRLARHLDASDARLTDVIERLVSTLRTPSEVVQSAVSDCLPALVRLRQKDAPALIERLMGETLRGASYAERRGAAYGLAGAVQGCGLTSLRKYSIVSRFKDALDDKKNPQARQGAIFGFEILASSLGRLFEPYLVETTSYLLTAFGDGATEVREATQDAARVIMRGLSGHAVKLLLPSLLAGLDDKQWRAKKGAIELMGAMAYLAPQQLSSALPTIIPRLTEVLTDTHTQVRSAANASLKRFGEVITSPEISAMQDSLLAALVDPARKTAKALDMLLGTAFVHYIDTSALALVVPIIDRGLRERSADIKRKATQIVGNLATLTEAKDLTPYLPQLMPRVRQVLSDPVPEARATAAKALGGLVERLGEDSFPDLVPSLFDTLRADASGVDQQGAAQGLSEIMSGLGTEKLEEVLPDIIVNTGSPRAYVREGFISLLVFLPATFGDRFAPYLGRIIQPVLSGLADDSDYVRDASMRAGKMIVANHSHKAIDLLLPELERGLFDSSWRIRQSSIQLLGDLLFRVAGITGKAEIEEEEEQGDIQSLETSRRALTDALGKERRDRVLAAVYIVRQDASGIVRSSSVHVWKALVHNTPKTVREIMPTLMQILVRVLAQQGDEQRETAARTLGELVRKLGEGILGSIITILAKAGTSDDVRTREGVCLAIIDVLESASKTQLEDHEDSLISIVRTALVDRDPRVREAAAQAFDSLQQQVGAKAVERTLPTLLNALRETGEASEAALAALKELMRVRASSILPRLVPVLNKVPISGFNARALSTLVSVAGPAVNRYLSNIVDGLRASWAAEKDEETRNSLDSGLRVIFAAVNDPEGLNLLMMHLVGVAKSETPSKRAGGCDVFAIFCQASSADLSEYTALWVRQLVSMFEDSVPSVVDSAWTALDEMVKTIPKDDMEPLVVPLRRSIESAGMPGRDLPGFCRQGGLKPIMPILLQGILAGTAEQREQAALAFGDVVERTSADYIKPFVTQITGPLIRIIGDRFPAPVKSAILHSLAVLLSRIPQFVKPFYPQLQRTFVKSLSDPTSLTVRTRAIAALGILMTQQPRIDPLVTELVTGARNAEESDLKESMILGLAAVCGSGGKNVGEAAMKNVLEFLEDSLAEGGKESILVALAKLVGGLAKQRAPVLQPILGDYVIPDAPSQISSLCLRELIEQAPDAIYELGILDDVVTRVASNAAGGQPPSIARPAREAKELLKTSDVFAYDEAVQSRL